MKILCSDFDGTLSYGGIDAKKCEMIHSWRESGNKFGIISGRGAAFYNDIQSQYSALEFDFFAACNGAIILDGEGNLLFRAVCNDLPFLTIAKELFREDTLFINLCGANDDWMQVLPVCLDVKKLAPHVSTSAILLDDLFEIKCFSQICAVQPTPENAAQLAQQLRKKYGQWVNPLQNGQCIDIPPIGVDKAQAVYRVMEHFGASYDDMITVGDNHNDAAMIREFRSYAMAHGVESIKAMANGIVSNVVEILQKEI
jgi:HAD superfamily hydrolase (TIGR01484 family)